MKAKTMGLAWIAVKDFNKAIKFYTEIVGLKLLYASEEWGWAELQGKDGEGIRLGIGKYDPKCQDFAGPGQNAVLTFSVDNIEKSSKEMQRQGATLIGDIEVVPGHVKLQTIKDTEGNFIQLVEELSQECHTDHEHHSSCCH